MGTIVVIVHGEKLGCTWCIQFSWLEVRRHRADIRHPCCFFQSEEVAESGLVMWRRNWFEMLTDKGYCLAGWNVIG